MENITNVTEDKITFVKNYPLDFLIIGPKEDNQLDIILQGSSEDRDYFSFDKTAVLTDLQHRVIEWGNLYSLDGSGKIDIGQHIRNQYTGYVLSNPRTSMTKDATHSSTTVKSGQALSIDVEEYDNYFYVWQGKVSALDRNKIQKQFTQCIPDIVKSLEQDDKQDDSDQIMQYLDPLVEMSIAATQAAEARTRQVRIARVIFISLAIVVLFAYLQFK